MKTGKGNASRNAVSSMRMLSMTLALAGMLSVVQATTLQQLSVDNMIKQSTSIVHAKVTGSRGAFRGPSIYTYYQLQILENLKGSGIQPAEVAVPGGAANGLRQTVAGAPSLSIGGEYVIFLWTSGSGLTQIIGLSQGLFNVMQNTSGSAVLVRPATTDLMLDPSGHVVNDQGVTTTLAALKTEVQQISGAGK